MALDVVARLVDGGVLEFPADNEFLARLRSLLSEGLEGKQLVHELITEEWGAPPVLVCITGTSDDGAPVDIAIPHR